MSVYETVKIIGKETQVKQPEGSGTALVTDYREAFDHLKKISELNDEARRDFFDTLAEDTALVQKAKNWNRTGREMVGLVRTLLNFDPNDDEIRRAAEEITDQYTKEAAIRSNNLYLHYDLVKKADPKGDEKQKAFDAVISGVQAFRRAADTQALVNRQLEKKNGEIVDPELEAEKEASERVARRYKRVPRGHNYWPARPYPPVPFPEGVRLPEAPRAFDRVTKIDPEIMEYDTEHDEFIVPKGYVSEDGLIDDESVVWDWENETVTMKYRGGVPVTWPFWKPKDAGYLPPPESWPMQYERRIFLQWRASLKRGLLEKREEEEEVPIYDRLPADQNQK